MELRIAGVLFLCAAAVWWFSNRHLRVTKRRIPIDSLPEPFEEFTILHLSDLHVTRIGKQNERLARRILEQAPDVILVTGDVFDRLHRNGDAFLELLGRLGGRFPVYLSCGNHERAVRERNPALFAAYANKLREQNVTLLCNTGAVLHQEEASLYIYGLDLPLACYRRGMLPPSLEPYLPSPPGRPAILLAHDPRNFPACAAWGADLTLSGHLHGGMIRLPFAGGLLSPDHTLLPRYDAGLYTRGRHTMYLSRGVGASIPLRIFSPPEIAVLTLCRREDEAP